MNTFSLTHLADGTLISNLTALVVRERANTAQLLAHLAEVESRRLYAPAGYPSMHDYCVRALHFSDQAAYKRIRAARMARRFPAIFAAVAEGRLHLSAIVLLSGCVTEATASDLLAAAEHRTTSEIELLLAHRFPRPDLPARVQELSPPASALTLTEQLSPGTVGPANSDQLSSGTVGPPPTVQLSSGTVAPSTQRPRVTPLAPGRFGVQLTIGQRTHDKLQRAKALLSHRVPSGDLEQVIDRALDALIAHLEKQKFAATDRPRQAQRETTSKRCVPAAVRRAVSKRDQGRCTFVSATGKRCDARERLEFDHVREVARGGEATVGNIRLRCRAHNQHTAECTFGVEFMSDKRKQARRLAAERAAAQPRAAAEGLAAAEIVTAREGPRNTLGGGWRSETTQDSGTASPPP